MSAAPTAHDVWAVGTGYDAYVGRWSRLLAREFVRWLGVPPGARWLDVGCGTGTLVHAIVDGARPELVIGTDRSMAFVRHARAHGPAGAAFHVADAQALAVPAATFDAVVSGLVINFVPDPARMAAEMARAGRPGSAIAMYVWDYGGGAEFIRGFWGAARALDPAARELDEATRFPICAPAPLEELLAGAGLSAIATRPIDVVTPFRDFSDYWSPFLAGQGPAPAYAMSLSEERRAELRELVRSRLPVAQDGSIRLRARAWAVRGWRSVAPAR